MSKPKLFVKKSNANLTHIYLNDKNLFKIVSKSFTIFRLVLNACFFFLFQTTIQPSRNILVLYLHNNQISRIEKLETFLHLTHLYLQWNNIRKIENLEPLKNLKQLYLGYNKISRLENVGCLKKLEQLHIERQQLDSMKFEFDEECVRDLANQLKVLNIKKLKLNDLDALEPLWKLEILLASENNFRTTDDISQSISALYSLRVVDLQGCPAQKDNHYREKITACAGHKLLLLDGKIISQSTRNFIKNFNTVKLEKRRRDVNGELPKTAEPRSFDSSQFSHIANDFPENSLFQVTPRRRSTFKVLKKASKPPSLVKAMSANHIDTENSGISVENSSVPIFQGLQGKEMKAIQPIYKEKLHRKVQSLPSID